MKNLPKLIRFFFLNFDKKLTKLVKIVKKIDSKFLPKLIRLIRTKINETFLPKLIRSIKNSYEKFLQKLPSNFHENWLGILQIFNKTLLTKIDEHSIMLKINKYLKKCVQI